MDLRLSKKYIVCSACDMKGLSIYCPLCLDSTGDEDISKNQENESVRDTPRPSLGVH